MRWHSGRYIKQMMEGPPYRLLRSLAHDITVGVLSQHLAVTGIKIEIGRPYVPITGAINSKGIACSLAAGHGEVVLTWLPACLPALTLPDSW